MAGTVTPGGPKEYDRDREGARLRTVWATELGPAPACGIYGLLEVTVTGEAVLLAGDTVLHWCEKDAALPRCEGDNVLEDGNAVQFAGEANLIEAGEAALREGPGLALPTETGPGAGEADLVDLADLRGVQCVDGAPAIAVEVKGPTEGILFSSPAGGPAAKIGLCACHVIGFGTGA